MVTISSKDGHTSSVNAMQILSCVDSPGSPYCLLVSVGDDQTIVASCLVNGDKISQVLRVCMADSCPITGFFKALFKFL